MARQQPVVWVVFPETENYPLDGALLKMLDFFKIKWRMIYPHRDKTESSFPKITPFCCIVRPHEQTLSWIKKEAANVPVLLMPSATYPKQSLEQLVQTNQLPYPMLALGTAGETNAALFAVSMLATRDTALRKRLISFRAQQTKNVLKQKLPS